MWDWLCEICFCDVAELVEAPADFDLVALAAQFGDDAGLGVGEVSAGAVFHFYEEGVVVAARGGEEEVGDSGEEAFGFEDCAGSAAACSSVWYCEEEV